LPLSPFYISFGLAKPLCVGMIISVGEEVEVDRPIASGLVPCLACVATEVAKERWTDDDVLPLELNSEICPIPDESFVAVNLAIVDMSHDSEVDELLHLLRAGGGVNLATIGL